MRLIRRLWRDEAGLVISAETMMVGTLGVIGAVAGIATATSAVNDEMAQLSQAFRGFDQSYSVTGTSISMRGGAASSGAGFVSGGSGGGFAVMTAASGYRQVDPRVDIQAVQTQYLQAVATTAQSFGLQNEVCGQTSGAAQQPPVAEDVVVPPQSIPAQQY